MPSLIKLYKQFQNSGFTILAINLKESRAKVSKYVEKEGIPFPVLLDFKADVAAEYGVRGTPAHYLIDKKGLISAFSFGGKDWEDEKAVSLIDFLTASQ